MWAPACRLYNKKSSSAWKKKTIQIVKILRKLAIKIQRKSNEKSNQYVQLLFLAKATEIEFPWISNDRGTDGEILTIEGRKKDQWVFEKGQKLNLILNYI